jgi:hypothetical protein
MKAKVLQRFKDKYDQTVVYKVGEVYEFTEERFEEILTVGKFVERIETEKPAKKKATKKKVDK